MVAHVSQSVGSSERLQKLLYDEAAETKRLLTLRHPNVINVYGLAIDIDGAAREWPSRRERVLLRSVGPESVR